VLREFQIGSKPIYFCNLGWIRDPEGVIVHRMRMSTTRCCTCGTKSLRRCCRTGVVASRSSQPWGQLRLLHRQHLCESVIPAFGLQGYVTEFLLIVTSLLLDRSWAIQGCVSNNFFVICTEPQQHGVCIDAFRIDINYLCTWIFVIYGNALVRWQVVIRITLLNANNTNLPDNNVEYCV
jgi:hypothetical protein